MAASSSVRKAMGARSGRGQISSKKIATHSESGTAIATARIDERTVPKMKGSAPKSPETGSHELFLKKLQPKAWMESLELLTSTKTISSTMAKMLRAQMSMRAPKAPSANLPGLRCCRKERMAEGCAGTTSAPGCEVDCASCGGTVISGSFTRP